MAEKKVSPPLTDKDIRSLRAGDKVLISGTIYTARDAAHQRLADAIKSKNPLPFNLSGQIIYYTGPAPAPKGKAIGSAGPTTSGRMDSFTPQLLSRGLKATIGKGNRSKEVKAALKKYKAVYFVATGGAGALLSKTIKSAKVIAYPELGPEAIYKLEVVNFPAIVANDSYGKDLFEEGIKKYRRKK
ncbi:MAG: Fe-S-containing hydro-lyase [Candidatus Saganbacteria bacterium]|nr:Fe-S-containing hydro-lyase [Candidatus Saganbacteria bacterium]